ncbi:hypothetical protein NDU88_007378 [Pleurodeles waltl]|uniref:Uncharacterized protein n=1 Tax=Pleurodeles waltl TaxID=8319 RepID=A0AAV7PNN2_PLEWA|nr:hypothetical protein NDU88_007378 [Pleurodeles waltl]
MDLKITDLTITSSSIRADMAGFKETADALDQRLTAVEDQVAALLDQEPNYDLSEQRLLTWKTGVTETTYAFPVSRNAKRDPISSPSSNHSCPISLVLNSHHHQNFREHTESVRPIKLPQTNHGLS